MIAIISTTVALGVLILALFGLLWDAIKTTRQELRQEVGEVRREVGEIRQEIAILTDAGGSDRGYFRDSPSPQVS